MSNPLSGVPRIIAGNTTASADDALAVIAPRDNRNAGELVNDILRTRGEALLVVVDPIALKVYATSHTPTKAAYIAAIDAGAELVVRPTEAKFMCKWETVSDSGYGSDGAFLHEFNRRTVVQVVNYYIRDGQNQFALVNQDTGELSVRIPANAAASSATLEGVAGGGFSVCYQLQVKDTNRLTFE